MGEAIKCHEVSLFGNTVLYRKSTEAQKYLMAFLTWERWIYALRFSVTLHIIIFNLIIWIERPAVIV